MAACRHITLLPSPLLPTHNADPPLHNHLRPSNCVGSESSLKLTNCSQLYGSGISPYIVRSCHSM